MFTVLCCVDLVLKYHLNNDYIYSRLVYIDFIFICSYSIGSSSYKPWLLSGSFCMNHVNLEVHELLILFSHSHFL